MNCIFCRLVSNELPANKLYDDGSVCAFLASAPINPGHLLIIPVDHHTSLTTVPDACITRMFTLAPILARAAMREIDGDGFNLHLANGQCAGQSIQHVHLNVIPRLPTDGFSWGWRALHYPDDDTREAIAAGIRKRLEQLNEQSTAQAKFD